MAKKKIDNPLFLEFVNFPIFGEKMSYDERTDFIESFGAWWDCIGLDNSSIQRYGPSVRNCMEHLLNSFDNRFSKKQVTWLKEKLFNADFNVFNPIAHNKFDETIQYRDGLIQELLISWCDIKNIFSDLIAADKERGTKYKSCYKQRIIQEEVSELFGDGEPNFYRKDTGEYEIQWEPYDFFDGKVPKYKKKLDKDPAIKSRILSDAANFILKQYRPGSLAECLLDSCENITIAANGRKYCCDSHRKIASMRAKKKDLEYKEYRQIRDKLRQRFNRHPHKDKMDREVFIRKNWDERKFYLYQKFYLDRHTK